MSQSSPLLRPHQTALLTASVIAAVAYLVPVVHHLLLPLQYLNTHLHELSHAIAAIVTGGQPQEIVIHADGSGVTPVQGGILLIVGPAGYIGATLIGAAMIAWGRTPKGAQIVLRTIAIVLMFALIFLVRDDPVGPLSGLVWAVVLLAASMKLRGWAPVFVCQFLGVQQCLNALNSVYDLLQISAFTDGHSDAKLMQQITYIPAVVWALGWCMFSLLVVAFTVRAAWRSPAPSRLV